MRRSTLFLAVILLLANLATGFGQERLLKFESSRGVHVYLPPSYASQPTRHYPVLYLHDGQNVFSSAGTNACFGWGSWELDKTADGLSGAGKVREVILVAVDNTSARLTEYSGGIHVANSGTNTAFENYADYLIHELKPRIDHAYRTLPDPANTGTLGSSLGGLCSLALAWEHPEVFGRAASLSGAFQIEHTNFLTNVLRPYHGPVKPFRIYLDSGAVDFTGGDDNRALTAQVAAELQRIGWKAEMEYYLDAHPMTEAELEKSGLRRDKWREAKISQHNEFYWRQRSWRALTFLFPPTD